MVRAAVLGLTEVYEVLGATPMELVENVQSAMLFQADCAGAFIDEDNVLHILLTSNANVELYIEAMEERFSSTPVFVQVNHSLNDLLTIQRTLAYAMLELAMSIPGFQPDSVVFR